MKTFKEFINESIKQNKRIGIEHFSKIKPLKFIQLMKLFKNEFKGVLKTPKVQFKEKFDGFNSHIIWDGNDIGLESSCSGPIFKLNSFSDYSIEKKGTTDKFSEGYDNLLKELKNWKELKDFLKENFPDGVKVQAEVLYLPFGIEENDKANFSATRYDKSKLGDLATFIIYNFKDLDGNQLFDIKEKRQEFKILNNKKFKFEDDTTNIHELDLTVEIENFEKLLSNYNDVERILLSRKHADRIEKNLIKNAISQQQEIISKRIISQIKNGKLGSEIEGVIIELENGQMYKIISDTFKKFKKEFDLNYKKKDLVYMELFKTYYDNLLTELTISPNYNKGTEFEGLYILDKKIENDVRRKLGTDEEIKFKFIEEPDGDLLKKYRGTKKFKVNDKFYIIVRTKDVKGHYGKKGRKNTTASSNVNEFLSLYFLLHPEFKNEEDWIKNLNNINLINTGILYNSGKPVSFETLIDLIDTDETANRDILIGYNNSLEIKNDLKTNDFSNFKLYWTPRKKPDNISSKNPSDIILQKPDKSYIGYSNKISEGEDLTPEINTNLNSFFLKLNDKVFVEKIQNSIDESWNEVASKVTNIDIKNKLNSINVENIPYTETGSKKLFQELGNLFYKNNLNFYKEDFYYLFRNNLISKLTKFFKDKNFLKYFLNTIGFYVYGTKTIITPCPYKLLIGSVKKSKIKEVSSNDSLKELILVDNSSKLLNIDTEYDNKSQSFKVLFKFNNINYKLPLTLRTRSAGGWSGKSLFITTSGIKEI